MKPLAFLLAALPVLAQAPQVSNGKVETFRELRILRYQEVGELSDWQVGNRARKGRSVKMLARKR